MVFSVWKRKISSFTLIEALVVVAIVGILASIGTVSYLGVRSKIRDAKRKSDLNTIAQAFEARKLDKTCSKASELGIYPFLMRSNVVNVGNSNSSNVSGSRWASTNYLQVLNKLFQCDKPISFYLPTIPEDPLPVGLESTQGAGTGIGMKDGIFKYAKAQDDDVIKIYYNTYRVNVSFFYNHFYLSAYLEAYPKGPTGLMLSNANPPNPNDCKDNERGQLDKISCLEYIRRNNSWDKDMLGEPFYYSTSILDLNERTPRYHTYFIGR